MSLIVAGTEMGGTGCKVAISGENGQYDSQYSLQILTTTSENTLNAMYNWLGSKKLERPFVALGIACFRSIDLDKTNLNEPIAFETDVNAPTVIEVALQGDASLAYITIGTSLIIQILFIFKCCCLIGFLQIGYDGNCLYHELCINGMSNAKSVADRLGILPNELNTVLADPPV
ncbi:unnamed protein product [Rotaria sordida]|uniref:Uncharacterized protein n=1 Tax=Rotaria sordida TaxID=392033 RepID=A0A813RM08_9BILA|nr:unnamed protein product [Rotaria sordida]CAF0782774.1 unnamed protein product [Rotaria sordida]